MASLVVKRLDVLERILLGFIARGVVRLMRAVVLQVLKKLSCGALSQQLPLRLIKAAIPDRLSSPWLL